MKIRFRSIPGALKDAFILLKDNNPLMLASSTAFFSTFSLSPILVLLLGTLNLIFKSNEISEELFSKIENTFGEKTVEQIRNIVANFQSIEGGWYITIGSTIFFIFVATTLLKVIKMAIHQLWHIKESSASTLKYNLLERLTGFAMIVIIGVLFLTSLLLDTLVQALQNYVPDLIPFIDTLLIKSINIVFSLVVVTSWFSILYKLLPEAKIKWKVAIPGGILTGLLFYAGKYGLGQLLVYSNLANIFGASASIALILLFIFYSSMIIYFGAAFTKTYAESIGEPIQPGKYGSEYEIKMVDK